MLYIHEFLAHGAENAISASELGEMLNMTKRDIRRAVVRERKDGIVILSDEGGYYLPSEDNNIARGEVKRWIARRTAEADTIMQTVYKAQERLQNKASERAG